MTAQADFTEQEWDLVRLAPAVAGMIVITADSGGMMRETVAMAKAYAEARKAHGNSELLDAVASARPERDHQHYSSPEEMRRGGLQHIRDAIALLETKATADEVDDYRAFVRGLTERVAARHEEHGEQVSATERAAMDEVSAALG